MKMFPLVVAGALVHAETGRPVGVQKSICYAPGITREKACTVCTDEKSGDACIRHGIVYPCSATMESCCNQDGVVDLGSTYEECMTQLAPVRPRSSRAVSNTPYTDNEYCSKFWDTTNNNRRLIDQFERVCHFEHFDLVNGQVQIWPAECFDNWVHGYAEPPEKAGFMTIEGVETPAKCQTLCQLNKECIRFIWQAIDYKWFGADAPDTSKSGTCTLKNETHISGAYDVRYKRKWSSSDYDSQYCDVEKAMKCWKDPKSCRYCEAGLRRCMWRSDMHVSGWNYCGIRRTCPEKYTTPAPDTPSEPTTITTSDPTTTNPEPTTATSTSTSEPTTESEVPTTKTEMPTADATTECASKKTDCHSTGDDCKPTECPTEHPDCRTPCDNCHHGVDVKIHEKPKLLRLAIDN